MTPRTRSPNAAARFVPARSARFTTGLAHSAVARGAESSTGRRPTCPTGRIGVGLRSRPASSAPAVRSVLAFCSSARSMNSAGAAARLVEEKGASERLRSPRLRSGTSTAASSSAALDWSLLGCSQGLFRDELPVAAADAPFVWIAANTTELAWQTYSHFTGRLEERRLTPNAIVELPAQSTRVFVEDEMGVGPLPRRDDAAGAWALSKLHRYASFMAEGTHRSYYAQKYPDECTAELVLLVHSE